jgi:hydrogenase expression/formation protein HypC
MCLAVPGKIVELRDDAGVRMAQVDFGGIRRETCLEYLPDAAIGEYVIVHVGFAISKVDEAEAARTLEYLKELDEFAAEEQPVQEEEQPAPEEDHEVP